MGCVVQEQINLIEVAIGGEGTVRYESRGGGKDEPSEAPPGSLDTTWGRCLGLAPARDPPSTV